MRRLNEYLQMIVARMSMAARRGAMAVGYASK
jgi:hypothetical protein